MSKSALGKASDGSLSNTKKERFTCEHCDETYVSYPSQTKGYCSLDCANAGVDFVSMCMSCHNKWEGLYLRPDTRGVE